MRCQQISRTTRKFQQNERLIRVMPSIFTLIVNMVNDSIDFEQSIATNLIQRIVTTKKLKLRKKKKWMDKVKRRVRNPGLKIRRPRVVNFISPTEGPSPLRCMSEHFVESILIH